MADQDKNKKKLNLAVYWAAACGGCCVSVLDVHEKLFDVIEAANLVFWPIALDIKYQDVEDMPAGHIDVTLFNGAIRNSENEHMAKLLRQKSKILIAYGSCAYMGGIPGLANLYTKKGIFNRIYHTSESTVNPENTVPQTISEVPEGLLELPEFYQDVKTLGQVVDVDYYLPGCPPQTERFVEVFMAFVTGEELPPKGSVVGVNKKTLCDECERTKTDNKVIRKFFRPWEVEDDGETCLLEQGIVCLGPATRGGCGSRCIKCNAPCRGCYGPPSESPDPGAKMMSAIATMIDSNEPENIDEILDHMADPVGTFYRYSIPAALIRKKIGKYETDYHRSYNPA
jgi:F420-non-reducing hydrogenase small subunit